MPRKRKRTVVISRKTSNYVREDAADTVALEARARHHGLTMHQAKDQRAGSVHGRLAITGQISAEQYEALERFKALRGKWQAVKGVPGRDTDGGYGNGGDMDPDWVRGVCEAHDDMLADLREAQMQAGRTANISAALEYIVMRGQSVDSALGSLRLAANALALHFGLDGRRITR